MAEAVEDLRQPYTVEIAGVPHTLLLTEEDLPRYPEAVPVEKPAAAPKTSRKG